MLAFQTGNPQPGTAQSAVHAYTFGKRVAGNMVAPCASGNAAEFVFNDTIDAGFGVGLMSPNHGGTALPVLAGGAVDENEEVCVSVVAIDGTNVPTAIASADAPAGAMIVGRATNGTFSTAADPDLLSPSLAILLYPLAAQTAKP